MKLPSDFDAVLFDCDGVLVDSEPIVNRVLCQMLQERGWALTEHECQNIFLGKAVRDEAARIERETGEPLTEAWLQSFRVRRNAALELELQVVPHAPLAVRCAHQRHQGRIACASGADRHKVEMQLGMVGLATFFEGRVFSGHELPRSKPHPDVYLTAAAALGVDPRRCLVVEDSMTGVAAGLAAGSTVLAYVPQGQPERFVRAGVHGVVTSMAQLLDFLV
jgi:HAD superfamily hydrolase (TIGR01509 family)